MDLPRMMVGCTGIRADSGLGRAPGPSSAQTAHLADPSRGTSTSWSRDG